MIITLLMIVLAINGGLYMGTIAYSAYRTNKLQEAIALLQNIKYLNA